MNMEGAAVPGVAANWLAALALIAIAGACSTDASPIPRGRGSASTPATAVELGVPDVSLRRLASEHYLHPLAGPSAIFRDGAALLMTPMRKAVQVLDLSTGRTSATEDLGNVEGTFGSVISPDGKRFAFSWYDWPHRELRTADVDGTDVRTLLRAEDTEEFRPLDWSPDGRDLLIRYTRADASEQLVYVAVLDGSQRTLRSFGWQGIGSARFSPDGRYVAYDRPAEVGRIDRDVFIIATDGSRETRITDGGGKTLLGWSPSGDALLFSKSAPDGSTSLWRVSLRDARVRQGPSELVRADLWGFRPIRLIGDALYYKSVVGTDGQAFVLEVDLDRGRALAPPKSVSKGDNALGPTAWSPDGTRLAYRLTTPGQNAIVVRSLATDQEYTYVPGLPRILLIKWSSDGSGLLLAGYHQGRAGVFRYDLRSGVLKRLNDDGWDGDAPKISDDGSTAYHGDFTETVGWFVRARDLASGEERVLLQGVPLAYSSPVLSPSQDRLAYIRQESRDPDAPRSLEVAPVSGGPSVVLFSNDGRGADSDRLYEYSGVTWSPDGRYVLFTTQAPGVRAAANTPSEFGRQSIMVVSAKGGPARSIHSQDAALNPLGRLSVHPDGRRLLFSGGGDPGARVELWVMEKLWSRADRGPHGP